jgi:carotenoid 1,2-hydratase
VVDPENHCALNVCLYGEGVNRWAMTERGRGAQQRSQNSFSIGPSALRWDGQCLQVDIDEITVPIPRRLRGRVRLFPEALCQFTTALDAQGRHRWGPIAPCSRIEVDFDQPQLSWRGHAYLDSNEGDEPMDLPFREWDWSRAPLSDGSTAVIYDVRPKAGPDRIIAQRFAPDGSAQPFNAPERHPLPRSKWLIERTQRSEADVAPKLIQSLEDTPFYSRATVSAQLLGESVVAVHERLDLPRVASWPVQFMLPWRMPRRAG